MNNLSRLNTSSGKQGGPRGWAWLGFWVTLVCLFAFVVGPWLQTSLGPMDQISRIVEEQNIDAGAYYYTEIEASAGGQRYLKNALAFGDPPPGAGWNLSFFVCLLLCLLILVMGFKTLPRD